MNGPDIENMGLKTVQGGASGRNEGANSGIYQCVEELQEEDAVKEQCKCNQIAQPPRGRSNAYSQLSGLEDVVFNHFIENDSNFNPEARR
jgi:hypothetical protein